MAIFFFFKAYFKENHPHVCLRGAVLQNRNLEESKLNVTQLKHSKAREKSDIRGTGQDSPTSVL